MRARGRNEPEGTFFPAGRPLFPAWRPLFLFLHVSIPFLQASFPFLQVLFPLLHAIRVGKPAGTAAPLVASANYQYGLCVLCALWVEKPTVRFFCGVELSKNLNAAECCDASTAFRAFGLLCPHSTQQGKLSDNLPPASRKISDNLPLCCFFAIFAA